MALSFNPGQELTADQLIEMLGHRLIKTADQASSDNDTTFRNDTHLVSPTLQTNTRYTSLGIMYVTATTVADFKWDIVLPASASHRHQCTTTGISIAGTTDGRAFITSGSLSVPAQGVTFSTQAIFVAFRGSIFISGTAGTAQIRHGKATAEASAMTVYENSWWWINEW